MNDTLVCTVHRSLAADALAVRRCANVPARRGGTSRPRVVASAGQRAIVVLKRVGWDGAGEIVQFNTVDGRGIRL